jgi:hypothetical protein
MDSIYTKDYENSKIAEILKEYSAKKYGRKREFVDAEIEARLGASVQEDKLPEATAVAPADQAAITTTPSEPAAAATPSA